MAVFSTAAKRGAVCLVVCVAFAALAFAAAPSPEQEKLDKIEASLRRVVTLHRSKKAAEAAKAAEEARAVWKELSDSRQKNLKGLLEAVDRRISAAERLVGRMGEKPAAGPSARSMRSANGQVSFVQDVGPLLLSKCGGCHVRNARGKFSMASYAALARGSESGAVVTPGKGAGSRLVDVLQSGDMPRDGDALAEEEIAMISRWIDQGAKFDGPDPTAALPTYISGASAPTGDGMVAKATGNESVLFVRDLAPVLLEHCSGCHGGNQPTRNLGLDVFSRLMRGGDAGVAVVAGKPADSLLIKKLRGTSKPQMPLRQTPLPEETIAKFETWIREGAKFDGPDADQQLSVAVDTLVASKMTHDELAKFRKDRALAKWRLGLPDVPAEVVETENLLVIGDLKPIPMKEAADLAEAELKKVARVLKAPANQPFMKGKLTLFLFEDALDYREFGTMVESRELPPDRDGHWRYNVIDAYTAVRVPQGQPPSSPQLAEQFAGVWFDGQWKAPRWFVAGFARTMAVRTEPRDPASRAWEQQLKSIADQGVVEPTFLASDAVNTADAALSYAFVKFLTTGGARYQGFLDAIKRGAPFNDAFTAAFGGEPKAVAEAWLKGAR